MIAFSPGIAQGAFELLNITTRQQLSFLDIQISFKRLGGMSVAQVCDVAQRFNWVHVDQDGFLRATNAGLIILSLPDYPSKLRQALLDYIEVEKPAWLQNVTFGRQRVLKFADICLVQVFIEAGLVDGISIDVVEFWDILAAAARNRKNDRATEIGRMGERLTLEYEEYRTGSRPHWVAIDNNADGYDILSILSRSDKSQLSIEVKTSTMGIAGSLHITRNEWDRALESKNHIFHLWAIKDSTKYFLAHVTPNQMSHHIPHNLGLGHWESVQMPFKAFDEYFSEQ